MSARSQNESKTAALTAMLAGGYIGFTDKGSIDGMSATLTGNTLGFLFAIGGEVSLNPVLSMGLEVRNITGTISSRKLEMGMRSATVNEDFNVSRFSLGGGFRMNI